MLHKSKRWLVDPSGKLFGATADRSRLWRRHRSLTESTGSMKSSRDGELGEFYGTGNKARFKYYEKRKFETYNFAHANLKRMYGENWQDLASAGI